MVVFYLEMIHIECRPPIHDGTVMRSGPRTENRVPRTVLGTVLQNKKMRRVTVAGEGGGGHR